jgi:hypothetical protein
MYNFLFVLICPFVNLPFRQPYRSEYFHYSAHFSSFPLFESDICQLIKWQIDETSTGQNAKLKYSKLMKLQVDEMTS